MLYTKKGDDGTTKTFGCDQRISKSSNIAEALGSLDEINSYLGLCKVLAKDNSYQLGANSFSEIVHILQENLFSVQAELAGADKRIEENKVKQIEDWIDLAEQEMPPIKTFFISGGSDLAATFDVARTIARRAERRVVGVNVENSMKLGEQTLKFMNRLSSILYALARLSNHKSGIKETAPSYN